MRHPKVTIVGAAGGVGSSLAHLLITAPDAYEIALIGRDTRSVACLLMDSESLAPLGRPPVVGHGDTGDFHDSDIIVITASVPLTAWAPRADSMSANAEVVHPYFREITKVSADWRGHVIVVTNPIDVLSGWLRRHTHFGRSRILGYSWNDSLRLRVAVARALGEDAADITAWVIGEHGDAFVPLFDHVLSKGRHVRVSARQRESALAELRDFYTRWGRLGRARTTVWTTASGVARMIHDLTHGRSADWTASVALNGEYGLSGVNVGVPVTMDARGVLRVVEWGLDEAEHTALHQAASLVRQRVDGLGAL
ncbi:hypothetical protein OG711_05780 [Streptomyces uncialis]|uniref:malate dehydrogenase n=1 Tax=Streptomyces uncialis TaxID=1048205 RepID=UPI00224E11CF|nr:hypothetical protein [Streptomyces uncialis]MCX4658737.1 hypothetical protein [Streptomyces uncialis]